MANLHRRTATLFFAGVVSLALNAQKPFVGKIIYDVYYIDLPDNAKDVEAALPQQLTAFISGTDLRLEQQAGLAGTLLEIQQAKADTLYQSFNFLDQRVLLAHPISEKPHRYRVVKVDDEKTVAGIDVERRHMQSPDGSHAEAWVDDKYVNPFLYEMPELKHLPLIFETVRNGIRMQLVAREVVERPLDRTYFEYPVDAVRISGHTLQRILE